ncbi:MAG TPA: NfeD family protein [Candidatus Cybelea sp.]|nr:NfeD family protein [Candidatus Cybelea sp.]
MTGFFDHLQFWHWLILAAVLAAIEMLSPGFACIWLGGAALATGIIVLVIPALGWETQLILFAFLAAISVFAWYRFGRLKIETEDATLNRRGESLVGRSGSLVEPIVNGRGRVKIDDSVWRAEGKDAPSGTTVTVTGVQGAILKVEKSA